LDHRMAKDVLAVEPPERVAVKRDRLVNAEAAGLRDGFGEAGRDDVVTVADLERDIVEGGVERDREVGGQGPGRGGPDDREELLRAMSRGEFGTLGRIGGERRGSGHPVVEAEGDVDRRRGMLAIL